MGLTVQETVNAKLGRVAIQEGLFTGQPTLSWLDLIL